MEHNNSRILLIEHCTRGISATFAQFLFGVGGGVRMNMVSNLKDAQSRLKEGGVGLILLSLHLPEGPGIELLSRVRTLAGEVPVAVLINAHEGHLADEARSLGAVGCYEYGKVPVEEAIRLCAPQEPQPPLADRLQATSSATQPGAAPTKTIAAGLLPPQEPAPSPQEQAIIPPAACHPEPNAEPAEVLDAQCATVIEDDAGDGVTELMVDAVAVESVESVEAAAPAQPAAQQPAAQPTPHIPEPAQPKDAPLAQAPTIQAPIAQTSSLSGGDRTELEAVIRTLEERCRELEAGQTALIEAEHLAIEREKAARLAAEEQARTLREQLERAGQPLAADPAEVGTLRAQVLTLTSRTHELERALADSVSDAQLQAAVQKAVETAVEEERAASQARKAAFLSEQARREEALRSQTASLEAQLKDCQWQLRDAQVAREAAQARVDELTASAALASGAARDLVELRAQLEIGAERRKHLENKLTQAKTELTAAQQRGTELEALVHRLHALADKAAEAEALAQQLEQLRKDLQMEATARQLTTVELNKAQAREARMKTLEDSSKDLEWKLHQREQELTSAQAQLDDLALWCNQLEKNLAQEQSRKIEKKPEARKSERRAKHTTGSTGPTSAAGAASAEEEKLRGQVRDLQEQVARVERERAEFARQQLDKLEELTALYEKAQLERLELSNQLANRPAAQ